MSQTKDQTLSPVLDPSNPSWNYAIKSFKLPPLTRIMLADVDAGSDTPLLVGQVLKWRKENGTHGDLFLHHSKMKMKLLTHIYIQLICYGEKLTN